MKCLLIFFILPFSAFAQDSTSYILPVKDGKVYYERVIEINSTSKDDLYKKAKLWALSSFNSQKNTIETDDKDIGLLAYKGVIEIPHTAISAIGVRQTVMLPFSAVLTILLKDNKAKITIDKIVTAQQINYRLHSIEEYVDFTAGLYNSKKTREKNVAEVYNSYRILNLKIIAIIDDLQKALQSKTDF